MPLAECVIFLLRGKERRCCDVGAVCGILLCTLCKLRQGKRAGITLQRSAVCNVEKCIFRADAGEMQRLIEALAEIVKIGERAAEIEDIAGDFASLRQSADGLIDDGFQDTSVTYLYGLCDPE